MGPKSIEDPVHLDVLLCLFVVQVDALLLFLLNLVVEVGEGRLHVGGLVPVQLLAEFQLRPLSQTGTVAGVLYLVVAVIFVVSLVLCVEEGAALSFHVPHVHRRHLLRPFLLQGVFGMGRSERVHFWPRLRLIFVGSHLPRFDLAVNRTLLNLEVLEPMIAFHCLLHELGLTVKASAYLPPDLLHGELPSGDVMLGHVLVVLELLQIDPCQLVDVSIAQASLLPAKISILFKRGPIQVISTVFQNRDWRS